MCPRSASEGRRGAMSRRRCCLMAPLASTEPSPPGRPNSAMLDGMATSFVSSSRPLSHPRGRAGRVRRNVVHHCLTPSRDPAVAARTATGAPRSVSAVGTIGPSPADGSIMPASSHVCRPVRTSRARRWLGASALLHSSWNSRSVRWWARELASDLRRPLADPGADGRQRQARVRGGQGDREPSPLAADHVLARHVGVGTSSRADHAPQSPSKRRALQLGKGELP
jgi:hypothetical protein